MDLLLFVLGLVALVVGAEFLVRGASRLALSFGISPLVVGLTVVAFGTSAPELAVSAGSALEGAGDVAIGNVIGSNIFNVLLILGLSAAITPLVVHSQLVRQEVPIMIGATAIVAWMVHDGSLDRVEAAVLLAGFALYLGFVVLQARRMASAVGYRPPAEACRSWLGPSLSVAAGLGLLVLGARWLVDGAVAFAVALGVSELVIGLTIVAAGTSLPEVATSVLAAARGQRDIAVGNVIGSNLFNLLACLGASGVVAQGGLEVDEAVRQFDVWVLLAVTVACLPVFVTGHEIARWEGFLFLLGYVCYTAWIVLAAVQHAALPTLRTVLLGIVAPITVLTLALSLVRHLRRRQRR